MTHNSQPISQRISNRTRSTGPGPLFNPTHQYQTASVLNRRTISKPTEHSTTTKTNLPINKNHVPRRAVRPPAMPAPQEIQRPRSLRPRHQSRLHEPDSRPRDNHNRAAPLRLLLPSRRSKHRRRVRSQQEKYGRRDSEGERTTCPRAAAAIDGGGSEEPEGIPGRVRG